MTETRWTSKRQQIEEEHERIHATIHEIESELDRLIAHPAEPGDTWELPGLVETLRGQFKSHFQLEESDGILEAEAKHHDPETRRRVDQLLADHRRFLHQIDRIVNEFDFSFVPGETVQRCFDGDLRKLIAALAVHEAAENVILDALLG